MSIVDPATGVHVGRILSRQEAAKMKERFDAQNAADTAAAKDAGFTVIKSGGSYAFKAPSGHLGPWLRSEQAAMLSAFEYWARGGE